MEEEVVILFKQCPRCGGDVDASYSEDVHCVQCGDRPEVVYPGPVVLGAGGMRDGAVGLGEAGAPAVAATPCPGEEAGKALDRLADVCPRCGAGESMVLEKVRPEYNTCFRCRKCSHVYSP